MEFITTNGQKKVVINVAPFKEMCALKSEAMKCLKSIDKSDLANIQEGDTSKALDRFIEVIINADTSEDFNKALFKCLGRCVYDEFHAITPQFFDDNPEAIEDYYEIVVKCIEVNLAPFFKSLVTALKTSATLMEKSNFQEQ